MIVEKHTSYKKDHQLIMNIYTALKKNFGFSKFKGLQEKVIKSILEKNDTFVVMPTGGGKSLCYQLPALMNDGTAIVISPLIALMKNQVDAIRGISENEGIAHVLNSSLNRSEVQRVKRDIEKGISKLLYVAPESLIKQEYLDFLKKQKISFFAIDEAHCISEWGHDFRPEYRNLREIVRQIDNVPIIALTATATEKVQEDILKTLGINHAKVFRASFNRPNLFYEVRPKTKDVEKDIIRFIKQHAGKSGIVYCLSRKKVEQITKVLQVNNIRAVPYHAGLDSKTRVKHQDMFLMEDCDVVVATIAFGMGIDKPDIRFVIHHDIPKSLESYYQETGRAGRDDGEGHCLAFYAYKDVEKLEKFMSCKPVAEQEVGHALLQDVVGYAETSISRRKYLLHYFGEEFDEVNGEGALMDDNTKNPKKRQEAKKNVIKLLSVIKDTKDNYKSKDIVNTIIGKENALLNSHKTNLKPFFGCGKEYGAAYWMALLRQVLVVNLIRKEIEQYGVLKLTSKGEKYLSNPVPFMMTLDHEYSQESTSELTANQLFASTSSDEKLVALLKDLRKKVALNQGVPPFAVFQDPSIDDMGLKYPVTLEELSKVHGVGEGKARKFGEEFIALISKYVNDHDIVRPDDLIVKGTGVNSGRKLYIIQNTDRKVPLVDIANSKGLEMDELIKEIEGIVYSGTKLNIDYAINDLLDDEQQAEIYDYLMDAKTDKIQCAMDEFDGDYNDEELRLMRIKFISEVAN